MSIVRTGQSQDGGLIPKASSEALKQVTDPWSHAMLPVPLSSAWVRPAGPQGDPSGEHAVELGQAPRAHALSLLPGWQ